MIRSGLCRLASAAIAVESMPPDRNEPTVTSARMCLATESSITSGISPVQPLGVVDTGRIGKVGWK